MACVSCSCRWLCEHLTPGLCLSLSRLSVLLRRGVPPQKSVALLIPPSFPLALRVTGPSLSQLQGTGDQASSWPRFGHPHSYHVEVREGLVYQKRGGEKGNSESPISSCTTPSHFQAPLGIQVQPPPIMPCSCLSSPQSAFFHHPHVGVFLIHSPNWMAFLCHKAKHMTAGGTCHLMSPWGLTLNIPKTFPSFLCSTA